jgi:hypothetical protein
VFNLQEDDHPTTTEGQHVRKRRKLESEGSRRRESVTSVVNSSAERDRTEPGSSASPRGSIPKKFVRSIGSHSQHHSQPNLNTFGNIESYNKIEAMMGNDRSYKSLKSFSHGLRGKSSPIELGNRAVEPHNAPKAKASAFVTEARKRGEAANGHNATEVDDSEVEEIEDFSPEPKRRKRVAQTSILRPKTLMKPINSTDGPPRRLETAVDSPHFAQYRQPNAVTPGRSPTGKLRRHVHSSFESPISGTRSAPRHAHRHSYSFNEPEYVEEDSVDLLRHDGSDTREEKNPAKAMTVSNGELRQEKVPHISQSISNSGDIPQSSIASARPTTPRMRKKDQSTITLDVTYMQAGQVRTSSEDGIKLWQVQCNPEADLFDVLLDGNKAPQEYASLVVKPNKIHKITYNDDSGRVVMSRATEPGIASSPTLLLETRDPADGGWFAQILKRYNNSVKVSDVPM